MLSCVHLNYFLHLPEKNNLSTHPAFLVREGEVPHRGVCAGPGWPRGTAACPGLSRMKRRCSQESELQLLVPAQLPLLWFHSLFSEGFPFPVLSVWFGWVVLRCCFLSNLELCCYQPPHFSMHAALQGSLPAVCSGGSTELLPFPQVLCSTEQQRGWNSFPKTWMHLLWDGSSRG